MLRDRVIKSSLFPSSIIESRQQKKPTLEVNKWLKKNIKNLSPVSCLHCSARSNKSKMNKISNSGQGNPEVIPKIYDNLNEKRFVLDESSESFESTIGLDVSINPIMMKFFK